VPQLSDSGDPTFFFLPLLLEVNVVRHNSVYFSQDANETSWSRKYGAPDHKIAASCEPNNWGGKSELSSTNSGTGCTTYTMLQPFFQRFSRNKSTTILGLSCPPTTGLDSYCRFGINPLVKRGGIIPTL
jgi:hypothetical protein